MRSSSLLVCVWLGLAVVSLAATVTAEFTSAATIPVTAASYSATGNSVSLSLSFTPPTGTNLTVIKNTGLAFISGQFSNLAHGQAVDLSYGGKSYRFAANYYGGTGNDLILQWAYQDLTAWGDNTFGELGNNSITNSSVPVLGMRNGVLAGKTVVSVATGYRHSLALCSDGTLAAWGDNSYGQLGNNSTTNSGVPVLVERSGVLARKTVVSVAAGSGYSLVLCSDGTLASWGNNGSGQLGNNSTFTINSSVPVLLTQTGVLAGKTVVSLAAGGAHSLALCSDGTVAAWGGNKNGQLGNNSGTNSGVPVLVDRSGVLAAKTVVSVVVGGSHSLALCSDGTVAVWGKNNSGQLGNNSSTTISYSPVLVNRSGVLAGKTVVSVAAGGDNSLALCSDGTLAAWGSNFYGQLGNNSTTNSSVPVLVTQSGVLAGKTVVSVAAGNGHSLVLCSDGTVAAWGNNNSGQLGNSSTAWSSVPVLVNQTGVLAGKTVVSVAPGAYHSLALAAVQNSNDLANLTVSFGDLNPLFDPEINSYSASVLFATSSITMLPTAAANSATIDVNGVAVSSGSLSQEIPLAVGPNTITVVVTAPDGVGTKTYSVSVTRQPASSIATLSGLLLGSGTLNPVFASGTANYTAAVTHATTSITVRPIVTDATASLKVNGITAASGADSIAIPLAVGPNTITTVVTAQDGMTTTTYTVAVTRAAPSVVSSLAGLALSSGSLSPAFSSTTKTYVASVSNATTSMMITPTVTDSTATLKVNGVIVSSDAFGASIPLVVGANTISMVVTAQDETTTSTYTVTVTRAPSAVSSLAGLALNSGTLSPSFSFATKTYVASVSNATTSMTIIPSVTDSTATLKVNGVSVFSGSASASIPLAVGANTITAVVTAQDGTNTSTYTVTVTRAPSAVSSLAGLSLGSGALSPVFASGMMTYTASVLSSVKSLQVTATVTDSTASVKINGVAVASGSASASIPLSVGNNTIEVVSIAQDGSTVSNYTITVFLPSAVATLSGLTCNSGALSPAFSSGTAAYAVSVANDCTGVTLTPTVTEPHATVRVNEALVSSGSASAVIPLMAGSNVINVVVTAQDGTTIQAYSVTVMRPSLNATFASAATVPLSVGSYDATGNFANLSLGYAPTPGTTLTLVKVTGLGFIQGRFTNLAQGQMVALTYQNVRYVFAVNYYGGTGNDLVLQWANDKTYAWGANSYSQLGNNGTNNSSLPTSVLGSGALSGKCVVAVSAGSFHSLALCADGTLAAWGRNDFGQLGNNSTTSSSAPVAITNSGALSGKTVVAISAGYYHNLALCSDGTVAAWGQNTYGQLGDGSKTNSSVPVAVSSSGGLGGRTVSGIAAGYYHNLAQCTDGSLVAWGRNTYGQLGNNSTTDSSLPVDITSSGVLNGLTVAQFAAGSDHSLVLCADGSLAAWGRNNYGQLGEGSGANSSVPVEVDSTDVLAGKIVTNISAGGWHNLALCSDGTLAGFGRNTSGQLGDGGTTNSSLPMVANLSGLSGKAIAAVQAANGHSLALCADGSIDAWGSSSNGQLGYGSTTSSSLPVTVTTSLLGSGERFMTLATGASASHSMALVAAPPTNAGFSTWAASYAGLPDSSALGDPDGDGIPNVLEYVLNGNPAVASAAVLPVVSQDASHLVFSFNRAAVSAADTTQVFQYSTDLSNWTDVNLMSPTDPKVILGAEDAAGIQPVTVMIPKQGASAMFGRLKVTQP